MRTLRLVLGDQVSRHVAALRDLDTERDVVMMCEVQDEIAYVPHHRQKIVLILSAMRYFRDELRREGATVHYVTLDEPGNSGSFTGELKRAIEKFTPQQVVVTAPGEYRVWDAMRHWEATFGLPVEIRRDDRFICTATRFRQWARQRQNLRMEFFYRDMRRETGLLMDGDRPEGGAWNFDAENRKPWPKRETPPARRRFPPDTITREVMALVERHCPDTFGTLDAFDWAVTRQGALDALDDFVIHSLPFFGRSQDAMKRDAPFLHHGLISAYLNIGLLTARETCQRVEQAYRDGHAPLNAAEGFIRQIIGWREYIRGVYWLKMPTYAHGNALEATRPLPWLYWSGETTMECMAQSIGQTRDHAYAHHIQRLMVTGNFALIAGIAPVEVERWYLAVFIDAYEWVELPNTHGMVLFADDGLLSSKPYAASGAYINRMSDYCGACVHDVKKRQGDGACPFNFLYWDFMLRHEDRLAHNPRMALAYKNVARLPPAERDAIRAQARSFLDDLPTRPAP